MTLGDLRAELAVSTQTLARALGMGDARRKHGDVCLDDYVMSRVRSGPGPA